MGRKSINTLPVEVLAHVLARLEDDDDLVSASSVSRQWFHVVNRYVLRRKRSAILRPEVDDFVPDRPPDTLSLIGFEGDQFERVKDLCADIRALRIGYVSAGDRDLDEKTLVGVLERCRRLKRLSFKNVVPRDYILRALLRRGFHDLQSLNFECSSDPKDVEKFLDQSYFPETRITIRPSGRQTEAADMTAKYPLSSPIRTPFSRFVPGSITTLKVDCSGLAEDAYKSFCYCEKLRSVTLSNCFRMPDEAVSALARSPRLNRLYITDAEKVTPRGWTAVFRASIASVALVRCAPGLSDDVFRDATAAGRRLELDLQNCKRVTGDGLLSALGRSERVSLTLDYSERLLDGLVEHLTGGMSPRMRRLEVKIQRLNATSDTVSTHLTRVRNALKTYLNLHEIGFYFTELFSKVDRFHRPSLTT